MEVFSCYRSKLLQSQHEKHINTNSVRFRPLVFVEQPTQRLLVRKIIMLLLRWVYLLLSFAYHLQQLLLTTVPLYLGSFPFVDFLPVAFQLPLVVFDLLVQLPLPRLLLFKLVLEGLILLFEFFALFDDAIDPFSDTLHLFFQRCSFFFLGDSCLKLIFKRLEFFLLPGPGGLYEIQQKLRSIGRIFLL